MRFLRSLVVAGFLAPMVGHAQLVRGAVVDAGERPLTGVVVVLLDGSSREVGRTFSDEKGEYRLMTPRPGNYRVRTLRIGYRAETSPILAVSATANVEQKMSLTAAPFGLDTLRVMSRNACKMSESDSLLATFRVWEQVRAALSAAELTKASRGLRATTVAHTTALDPVRLRVQRQEFDIRSDFVTQPWKARSPYDLHRLGYVVQDQSGAFTYYAPGLDALLSPEFLEDHCLKMTTGRDPSRIGIEFEPNRERDDFGEIKGTLWLDKKTSELKSLQYKYTNISKDQEGFSDGAMEFAPMKNGLWAISKWSIRMPSFAAIAAANRGVPQLRVDTVYVYGGELSTVLDQKGDTLWARPTVSFKGVVVDSANAPVGSASIALRGTSLAATTDRSGRFALANVLPGSYTVEVRSASLDSMNTISQSVTKFTDESETIRVVVPTARQVAASICKAPVGEKLSSEGIIVGQVGIAGDTTPPTGAVVTANWMEGTNARTKEFQVDSRGMFRFCEAPVNAQVTLQARAGQGSSAKIPIRLGGGARFGRVELAIEAARPASAIFRGIVVEDSTLRPLENAEVTLKDIGLSVRSNDKGEFRIEDIVPGKHSVVVRRVGFGALETELEFPASETVDRRVRLGKVTVLEPMTSIDYGNDPMLKAFAEHKARGFGVFMDRVQLQKFEALTMQTVAQQITGLRFARGNQGQMFVMGTRGPNTQCRVNPMPRGGELPTDTACIKRERLLYVPDPMEMQQGVRIACYAEVWMDRTLLNRGFPTNAFDINSIAVSQVEALEWYTGASQVPHEYRSNNTSFCGVLILHSRRGKK